MEIQPEYDVAIIGGGLAGLSAAIRLSQQGHSVVLFEKEKYPFHKVCGEYMSMESWDYLVSLGINLEQLSLPLIKRLSVTAPSGKGLETTLPLGGFGISRYQLDSSLADVAKNHGVVILEQSKVHNVHVSDKYNIYFNSGIIDKQTVTAKFCCGAFGKKSNLDVKWKRKANTNKNFVAVKYHVKSTWEDDVIGLHFIEGGYCGISRIEDKKYCLCYIVEAKFLKIVSNDLQQLQRSILSKNKRLEAIFSESTFLNDFPVTISQISFNKKDSSYNNILMLGDAAGMIVPLAGNGMSIALHTGKIAADLMNLFLTGKITITELQLQYKKEWNNQFRRRFYLSRVLQKLLANPASADVLISILNRFPFLTSPLIKLTHGKPY